MDTFNIWDKLNIRSSKIVLLLLFLSVTNHSFSQHKIDSKAINLPNYDERQFHYGFTVGINNAAYEIKHSEFYIQNNDSILGINPERSMGFTVGFIVNFHINDNFDFRLLPNVGFYNRDLEYTFKTIGVIKQEVETNVIELPLLLKYKSTRQGNFRAYVIGGVKPGIEVSSKVKEGTGEENLRVQNLDLVVEYGFGVDVYNPMFKFSPEIRFAHGLQNMLVKGDPNVFTQSLDRISTHTVTLYFHFE